MYSRVIINYHFNLQCSGADNFEELSQLNLFLNLLMNLKKNIINYLILNTANKKSLSDPQFVTQKQFNIE